MSDLITGIIGSALFVTFVAFILVRVSDPALWIVSFIGFGCMLYALWGDTVVPLLRRRGSTEHAGARSPDA